MQLIVGVGGQVDRRYPNSQSLASTVSSILKLIISRHDVVSQKQSQNSCPSITFMSTRALLLARNCPLNSGTPSTGAVGLGHLTQVRLVRWK
jgi:hypothetical protein